MVDYNTLKWLDIEQVFRNNMKEEIANDTGEADENMSYMERYRIWTTAVNKSKMNISLQNEINELASIARKIRKKGKKLCQQVSLTR